jgi:hypothetical protein
MTRDEAEQRAAELGREDPDRATHRFFAREGEGGEWTVVKVPGPGRRVDPLKATTEAKPAPPMADDPRPSAWRDTGGYGVA